MKDFSEQLLETRSQVYSESGLSSYSKSAEEGGCGVTGFTCTIPLAGRFIYEPSIQMQNRGNGKGGGIAAVGFVPEQIGVAISQLAHRHPLDRSDLFSNIQFHACLQD